MCMISFMCMTRVHVHYKNCHTLIQYTCPIYGTGTHSLSLSSIPVSEEDQIRTCPHTSVILTCTATQVFTLTWRDQSDNLHTFVPRDINNEERRVIHDGPYTLILVAVNNLEDFGADFTSTLEVMVDDIDNRTNITCQTVEDEKHKLIYKISKCIQ